MNKDWETAEVDVGERAESEEEEEDDDEEGLEKVSGGQFVFSSGLRDEALDIPALKIIKQTLDYATELEKIV